MTTLREAAQRALEVLEDGPDVDPILAGETEDALRAALAEPEQKPISDVTEAVTKTVIETEKLLCEKIGRQWQPSGMSIQTLVDELATRVAAAEREACAKVAENTYDRQIVWYPKGHYIDPNNLGDINKAVAEGCAAAIRARSEQEQTR